MSGPPTVSSAPNTHRLMWDPLRDADCAHESEGIECSGRDFFGPLVPDEMWASVSAAPPARSEGPTEPELPDEGPCAHRGGDSNESCHVPWPEWEDVLAKIQREEEQSRVDSTRVMNPVIMDGSTTVLTRLGREDSQSAPA